MLPKNARLNLKLDFNWIRSGQKLENDLVRIFYKFGDNPYPRLGIATPTKDFKLAIKRNRARRLVSRAVEVLYSELPQNLNLLIFPKKQILEKTAKEVEAEMKGLLSAIHIS